MNSRKWPRLPDGTGKILLAIWSGAVLGMVAPLMATAVHLHFVAEDWTANSAWLAHTTYPILWFIDFTPIAVAALAGFTSRNKLQNAAREAREHRLGFEALMRIAQHGIVVTDPDGAIIEWSKGAEDLFGYTAAEVMGTALDLLIATPDRRAFAAEVERSRHEQDRGGRFVLGGQKQDGRPVALEISLAAWPTAQGSMLGVVFHDISKQILAERRLGEVERNWRDIAENSSDVLLSLDSVGTIIFANRGLLDRPVDEVIGNNVIELLPQLAGTLDEALAKVFVEGVPFEHEGRTDLNGKLTWLWCRFAPQREDGEVVQAVLSISDVTERRARDLALRGLAGIVERMKDAVLATDAEGSITTWNRGAEMLWGYSEADILGRNLGTLCPPDRLEEQRGIFARLRDNRHVNPYDAIALAKNRRRIPIAVSVASTRGEAGQFEGISAVVRDMSHQQELQEALQVAKSHAETASQLKSEFLANMSHEVRTPLNGVVGMADLLRGTRLTPEQEGYVTTLLEASQALRVIVDDVLDFSKIEAGQLRIENVEFELIALARTALDMFRHAADQNETVLRLVTNEQKQLRVLGDPNRIRQVMINLLNNAVKFTRNGGVDLRLDVRDVGDSNVQIRVEVEDTGVGISPEAQALIFQPFAQADGSITRRFGGTGLGLSICRKLMDLMGGKIGFSSQVGTGSTFWFEVTLPRAKTTAARKRPANSSLFPKSSHGWRILVAEDNAINQKVVCAMLKGLGANVEIANNGREAVELWQSGNYDLILMDCQMPVMSGFEATEAIRRVEGERRIPIIAMTAQAYVQDRERCTQAGMDDHLAKPVTRSELKSTIAKWLKLESTAPLAPAPPPPKGMTLDIPMLERLETDLGDDGKEVLGGLVEAFFADFQAAMDRLDAIVEAQDWAKLSFEAHRLRSSTSNLAAADLAVLCRNLEECGQRPDPDLAAELMLRVREEYGRVREALTAHVGRVVPASGERSRDMSNIKPTRETTSVPR